MSITNQDHIKQYEEVHSNQEIYGQSSLLFKDQISLIIKTFKPKSILDYGCGKGKLMESISKEHPEIKCYNYDPSICKFSTIPIDHVDMIINTDVLEHIPEEDIDDVLQHISSLCNYAYFNLHHGLAACILPNGENAHCTVKPREWYYEKMTKYFTELTSLEGRNSIASIIITKKLAKKTIKQYYRIILYQRIHKISSLKIKLNKLQLHLFQGYLPHIFGLKFSLGGLFEIDLCLGQVKD